MKIHSHYKVPKALYLKIKNGSLLLVSEPYIYKVVLYDINIYKKSVDCSPYAITNSFYVFILDKNIELCIKSKC